MGGLPPIQQIERWIAERMPTLAPWMPDHPHPSLRISYLFSAVRAALLAGDRAALGVAVDLLHDDPRSPFGKTIKCSLARALYQRRHWLGPGHIAALEATVEKLAALPYPPTELKYMVKVVEAWHRQRGA